MIKITPLAADSMGCRSMATFVETRDCRILIEPGASVEPYRQGHKPHPLEEWMLKKSRERIILYGLKADVIVVTNFHDDHFIWDAPRMFRGKTVCLKNPNQNVPISHRNRVFQFLRNIEGSGCEVSYVDGRSITIGDTQLHFSKAILHSDLDSSRFIQCAVQEDDYSFLFSSDVMGLRDEAPMDFMLSQDPTHLYLDGPVTYIGDHPHRIETLQLCMERLIHLLENTRVADIILDHHLLRDLNWKSRAKPLVDAARKRNVSVRTAAEVRGEEDNLLEARRDILYEFDQSL